MDIIEAAEVTIRSQVEETDQLRSALRAVELELQVCVIGCRIWLPWCRGHEVVVIDLTISNLINVFPFESLFFNF